MGELAFNKELKIQETSIPGLLLIDLPVFGDNRGWFKENWQREKMGTLGLPDFGPVQNNISFNVEPGTTRGIHAEPWDKYVSVASGKVFGAWVDLREGESFGTVFTTEIDPTKAIFVPRGIGNGFQALEPNTAYTYLVNDHWSPDASSLYTFLNLADETANIQWPIPLEKAELSDKDRNHPRLNDVTPMKPRGAFVVGANGQLGTALRAVFPNATFVDRNEFDMSDPAAYEKIRWQDYDMIINAAAMTNVDGAETDEGRELAWKLNATSVARLATVATQHHLTLVHISSDYVFDGTHSPHEETENFTPLSVYGASKAAGDIAVAMTPKHYIIRTTWVIGNGKNFVRTMWELAQKGVQPKVVNNQIGRLTFTKDLAESIAHLASTGADYGTYNMTNDGESVSWADIAQAVYLAAGKSTDDVSGITTKEYFAGKENIAPRPLQSEMNLAKIKATGFMPRNWREAFDEYTENLKKETA